MATLQFYVNENPMLRSRNSGIVPLIGAFF